MNPTTKDIECAERILGGEPAVQDWCAQDKYNKNRERAAQIIAQRVTEETRGLREAKDGAYAERNQLVAALSKLFPAGIKRTEIDGWDKNWENCVYIDLPTGQVSWHIHDSEIPQFSHLPPYSGTYDGHDTPEKYRRLAALHTPAAKGE